MPWLLSLFITVGIANAGLRKVDSCQVPKSSKLVAIIKQWHLPPTTATKGFKERYPQETNQSDIYNAVSNMIKKKKIQLLVAEGCEGEINGEFKTVFNGWDLNSLKNESQRRNFDRILTNVAMKLEARHGDKILTLCGDNEKLIQEGNLRISNLRGWLGFWTRLTDSKNDPERQKLYGQAAADLLRLSHDTPADKLIEQIKEQMKSDLEAFQKSLNDRNDGFVKVVGEQPFQTAAVVIGGLHAEDLKKKLQAAGIGCDVLEPRGYQREEEDLVRQFQNALK